MIERIRFGRTGLLVTKVAFGGIPIQRLSRTEGVALVRGIVDLGVNFLDTARLYGHSEELIGEALAGVPRHSVVIASKSPAADKKTLLADLDESLHRLRTDYIDIYQLHGVSSPPKMAAVMGPGGAVEGLEEAIRAGKIRFPAFSSHSLVIAEQMIRTDRFDALQIPFNFVDHQAADKLIPLAREADMGTIAMKPLGGGLLEDARLCFHFLSQYPDVVPDPGIETLAQMREIVEALRISGPLTAEELSRIEGHRAAFSGEWCHRCEYCQPCPQSIPISTVLVAKSFVRRMPYDRVLSFVGEPFKAAQACTECRQCAERCPYGLDIPLLLKKQRAYWQTYQHTRQWD